MRRTGVLVIIGFILIIYIGLGFVYWQQGTQQKEFTEQINKLSLILARPLPDITELQAEYDKTNQALAPMEDSEAINRLVSIAEKSGISIGANATDEFKVPPAKISSQRVGGSDYKLLSFKGVSVSGNYSDVITFINDLDSGETLETMVLTKLTLSNIEYWAEIRATTDVNIYTNP